MQSIPGHGFAARGPDSSPPSGAIGNEIGDPTRLNDHKVFVGISLWLR